MPYSYPSVSNLSSPRAPGNRIRDEDLAPDPSHGGAVGTSIAQNATTGGTMAPDPMRTPGAHALDLAPDPTRGGTIPAAPVVGARRNLVEAARNNVAGYLDRSSAPDMPATTGTGWRAAPGYPTPGNGRTGWRSAPGMPVSSSDLVSPGDVPAPRWSPDSYLGRAENLPRYNIGARTYPSAPGMVSGPSAPIAPNYPLSPGMNSVSAPLTPGSHTGSSVAPSPGKPTPEPSIKDKANAFKALHNGGLGLDEDRALELSGLKPAATTQPTQSQPHHQTNPQPQHGGFSEVQLDEPMARMIWDATTHAMSGRSPEDVRAAFIAHLGRQYGIPEQGPNGQDGAAALADRFAGMRQPSAPPTPQQPQATQVLPGGAGGRSGIWQLPSGEQVMLDENGRRVGGSLAPAFRQPVKAPPAEPSLYSPGGRMAGEYQPLARADSNGTPVPRAVAQRYVKLHGGNVEKAKAALKEDGFNTGQYAD